MLYSEETKGIYLNGQKKTPADALPIPAVLYKQFTNAEINGFDVKNGKVIAYVPPPTLAESQENALQQIAVFNAEAVNALTNSPSQSEVNTWPLQMLIADAVLNNARLLPAGAAFLAAAQIKTTAEKTAYAEKVLAASITYATVAGMSKHLSSGAKQAVLATTTVAEIEPTLTAIKQQAEAAIEALKAASN